MCRFLVLRQLHRHPQLDTHQVVQTNQRQSVLPVHFILNQVLLHLLSMLA
jgi:predicted RNA-binding protein with PUA-like domain